MSPLLLLLPVALAAGPEKHPCAVKREGKDDNCMFETWGELRLIESVAPDLQLNNDGAMLGQEPVLDSRLRAGMQIGPKSIHLIAEGDMFESQIAGDAWDVPGTEDARERHLVDPMRLGAFDLRKASVGGRTGVFGFEAGLTTSHWGLGMVANDGDHDPVFGRNDFGDRVLRVRVGTRPIQKGKVPLYFILAGDRVVEDELAVWTPFDEDAPDQAAWQGVATILYRPDKVKDGPTLGIYGVYRHQTEDDKERTTDAGVMDMYGDWTTMASGWELRIAGEVAGIIGNTSRTQTYNSRDGVKVRSAGATGLFQARPKDGKVRGLLRTGWASGDGDPDDDTLHDFTFDRDFDAGMVTFDEVQGAIDAATYAQLNDPAHSGGAPEGAEGLVTEGAFGHAMFLQPVVGFAVMEWLDLQAGATFSWGTKAPGQAFETYRNGGVPANHLGQPTEGYGLGTELDWAVKLGDISVTGDKGPWAVKPALLLQGGHLLANDNLGGGTHTLFSATGRVRW
jgi:hypothetical protein